MNPADVERIRRRALAYAPYLAQEMRLPLNSIWAFAHGYSTLPDSTMCAMARRMQVAVTS
jgi:hypothetical protein